MSLNSLKIATEGYLKRATKAALIIAVSGYLNYSDGPKPPTPLPPAPKIYSNSGSGYGIDHRKEQVDRIRQEDKDILTIINVFLACQG